MSVSQAAPNLEMPVQSILMELMYTVGVPYILLATTASIVPTLVDDSHDDAYKLFGWSNAGSIVGLVSYPFLIEPFWALSEQLRFWGWGFCVWAMGMMILVIRRPLTLPNRIRLATPPNVHFQWMGLSALGVGLLMAISDAIMTDLQSPMFWSFRWLYLLSS